MYNFISVSHLRTDQKAKFLLQTSSPGASPSVRAAVWWLRGHVKVLNLRENGGQRWPVWGSVTGLTFQLPDREHPSIMLSLSKPASNNQRSEVTDILHPAAAPEQHLYESWERAINVLSTPSVISAYCSGEGSANARWSFGFGKSWFKQFGPYRFLLRALSQT